MKTMSLKILFGQRIGHYPDQFGPEALVCWDENTIEENEGGFEEEVNKTITELRKDFSKFRVVNVAVDEDKIRKLLTEDPYVFGEVK